MLAGCLRPKPNFGLPASWGFVRPGQRFWTTPRLPQEQPFMQQLKSVFIGAIGRPVTPKYPQVTLVLQSAISRALTNGDVKSELKTAKEKIQAIVKT